MHNIRILDLFSHAMHNRRMWVRDDCTGSVECVAELHLEEFNENLRLEEFNEKDMEIHLTYEECKRLRAALKIAMKEWIKDTEIKPTMN